MGGLFFHETGVPCLWHAPFPPKVQARLITAKCLKGDITNSDLDQAGMICRFDIVPWENQPMRLDDSLVELS